jgi:four helix bundle protein
MSDKEEPIEKYPCANPKAEWIVQEGGLVRTHRDLRVYQSAKKLAVQIHELAKNFPKDELYSMTKQIRDSSRSVAANIAEAWRKRRYPASFISKLSDAEGEGGETQVWLEFAIDFEYIDAETGWQLVQDYEKLIGAFVLMSENAELWTGKISKKK